MLGHSDVYAQHADLYERMIQCEDKDSNLPQAIETILPLNDLDVVEFGAGTGRVTRFIAPRVASIYSFDYSHHMLSEAAQRLPEFGIDQPALVAADHRAMPVVANCADLAVQGWSFLHLKVMLGDDWLPALTRAHAEMVRVLHPGGMIIHIETLGTGFTTPQYVENFAPLYEWWEDELGFEHRWIRTDFQFSSRQEAIELMTFFFGEDITDKLSSDDQPILPECTGLWWLTV